MGVSVERSTGQETVIEVYGPRGAQEYQSEKGWVSVRGLWNAAKIQQDDSLTELVPEDAPVEVILGPDSKLKISATYDQPDE